MIRDRSAWNRGESDRAECECGWETGSGNDREILAEARRHRAATRRIAGHVVTIWREWWRELR